MWKDTLRAAGASALLLATAGSAQTADLTSDYYGEEGAVYATSSVDVAYGKLHRRGYYDIRIERASEPYSFIACKHGARYHIHINAYGDFEQVDPVGSCGGYGNGYGYSNGYGNGYRNSNGYGYARGYRYSNGYDEGPRYYARRPYYERRYGGYLRPFNDDRSYGYRRVHDDY